MKRMMILICLVLLFTTAKADEVIVTFGGDCVLGTREEWKDNQKTFDTFISRRGFDWCFKRIGQVFLEDDITLINLECVLQKDDEGHRKNKLFTFRGDPSYAVFLKQASVEQVNIANNHYIDYGRSGRESTRAALAEAQIGFSGYTYRSIANVRGYKIGFAGCRETVFLENREAVYRDLQYLKEQDCDVIIYSCHWGKEYSPEHNSSQIRMADYALKYGADIVVGTHPHCVQGIEYRRGGVVLYSLGNLIFGGTHDMTTFDAAIMQAVLQFEEGKYQGVTLKILPVLTSSSIPENNFQPIFAPDADYKRIMQLIQNDSDMKIDEEMWFPAK